MAWPEKPVKSSAAIPSPKPRKATLLTVVIAVVATIAAIHRNAERRAGWSCACAAPCAARPRAPAGRAKASHSAPAQKAGSRICASPTRVTASQNSEWISGSPVMRPCRLVVSKGGILAALGEAGVRRT